MLFFVKHVSKLFNMQSIYTRRATVSWALYDWANSAFYTTVVAGFFPIFFQKYWSSGVDPTVTTSRLGFATGIAGFIVALLAPVLGAMADRSGTRKRQLFFWSMCGVLATASLSLVGQGQWFVSASLFVIAAVGASAANVFYDSLILNVSDDSELDRVSAFGFSLGYLGGGLLFSCNVLMTIRPQWFGLVNSVEAVRASFFLAAVWWLFFSLPLLRNVHEAHVKKPLLSWGYSFCQSFVSLLRTIKAIREYPNLSLFLIAYWLYIDGVNTIYAMAVDYGVALGLPTESLLAALLLTQFVAFPASLTLGWVGYRFGAKKGILFCIFVYLGATIYAYFLNSISEFFALAVVVGLVQGGIQSLSRSFFARLIPVGRSAEFFGFYNMMGKFASILGPILIGSVALITSDSRASISSLMILFFLGGVLMWRIPSK